LALIHQYNKISLVDCNTIYWQFVRGLWQ